MDVSCPYAHWTPGTVAFCEERLCAWIVEPSNTYSSFAYLIAGVLMLRAMGRPRDARLVCIALAQFLIGVGSLFFHATGTLAGELVDQAGMFMLSCLLLVFAASAAYTWPARKGAWVYGSAVSASVFLNASIPPLGIPLFAAQLILGAGWELRLRSRARDRSPYRHLLSALAIFAVSFCFWALDISHVLCRPDNHLVTGHAVWHVLNAISIYQLYWFQRARLGLARPGGAAGGRSASPEGAPPREPGKSAALANS